MSRFLQAVVTLTWLTSSFTICDSCAVVGGDEETGVNCTFENDICTWENAYGNDINWTRNNGNNFWNVRRNTKESFQGKYMSTTICSTENRVYSLRFRYRINQSICKLSVKLQSEHGAQNLWSRNDTTRLVQIETPVNISSPDVEFKIVFLAEKIYTGSKMKCLIRIDDIVYEYTGMDIPRPATTSPELVSTLSTAASQTSTAKATAAGKETTHVSIQSTEKDVDDTTAENTTRDTSETMEENATDGYADADDSDNGLAIGLGVSVAAVAVLILVVVVIIVIIRRRGSDGNNGGCTGILNRRRKKQKPDTTPDILKLGEMNSTYSHEMQPENVSLRRDRVSWMSQGVSGSHDAAARRPNICVTSSGYVEMEIGSFSERSRDCGGSGYITLDDATDSTDNQDTRQASENMYEHLVPVDGHTYSTLQSKENEYERLAPADTRSKNVYSMPQFKKKESK